MKRADILPEAALPPADELIALGRARAKIIRVGDCAFLSHYSVLSEAAYKREAVAAKRIMQHAQIGYRDLAKSRRAWFEIWNECQQKNVRVDRYGICLDWTMGLPRDLRSKAPAGTGLILQRAEDFAALSAEAPVAPHFGDFILGFPASLENTEAALLAGATSIGNLGQFFMFRLPNWDDDVTSTSATLQSLALIAAQEREVLIHSNLDDGFAAIFTDLSSVLGMVLVEQHVIEGLLGGRLSHCWGHHFSDPLTRLAFHLALTKVAHHPGTMVYGNTVQYQGSEAENYASLASYLLTDIQGQHIAPSGHAINPVPVTENSRIPDIDEVIAAQLFAGRLVHHGEGHGVLLDPTRASAIADEIIAGGQQFRDNLLAGFTAAGIDTNNAFKMLLTLRRLGPKRLEQLYGAGAPDQAAPRGRRPKVAASLTAELAEVSKKAMARAGAEQVKKLATRRPRVIVASTDVHEHGKLALEQALKDMGAEIVDGGISVDADDLASAALAQGAEAVMVSTYNGIALDFFRALKIHLAQGGAKLPILIGGRLNQVPENSNSSLPVDVTAELKAEGAIVCTSIEAAVPVLAKLERRA